MSAVLTGLFALLCAVSASLQYNDPDPLRWGAVYLACGASAIVLLPRPGWWPVTVAVAIAAAIWSTVLWAGVAGHVSFADFVGKMSEKGGKVEELREAAGLSIAAIGCALCAWAARKRKARGWRPGTKIEDAAHR